MLNMWYKLIEKNGSLKNIYNFYSYTKNIFIKDYEPNNKVFVIGLNKTGTTSLEKILQDFGYKLGNQADAELLTIDVLKGQYRFFLKYLKTANAFQDLPFSTRNIYKLIDKQYPNAKFILTLRSNSDIWYTSFSNFTKKILKTQDIECENKIEIDKCKKFMYRYPSFFSDLLQFLWLRDKTIYFDEDEALDRDYLTYYYNKHIKEVKDYFENTNKLLIVNLEEEDAYSKICLFLGKEPIYEKVPHLNKTQE